MDQKENENKQLLMKTLKESVFVNGINEWVVNSKNWN